MIFCNPALAVECIFATANLRPRAGRRCVLARIFLLVCGCGVAAHGGEPAPHPAVTFHAPPKALPAGAVTHDWTSFLGPAHNATSTETHLLKTLAPAPGLVWEMRRGAGYASPAILGERLVFIHRLGDREVVECLHPESGAKYWSYDYKTDYADKYGYNNGPRSSPVIGDGCVYTYSAQARLHCLRLETGEVLWQRDLASDYRLKQEYFGAGTTPLIENGRLIVNVGAPGGPCVVALDAKTGRELWADKEKWGASYASPVPAVIHGKRRILVFAGGESRPPSGGLLCLDPESGAVDCRFPWRSRSFESVNAATPVAVGNQVFISASYETGGALVETKPDFSSTAAWTSAEFGTHWDTAIHHDGHLYGFDGRHQQNAQLVCVELKSGRTLWRTALAFEQTVEINGEKRNLARGMGRAALLRADGRFLCLGETGELAWLELSPRGHKVLSHTFLFYAPESWAVPVLSRGLLYITQNHRGTHPDSPARLLCYDFRAPRE